MVTGRCMKCQVDREMVNPKQVKMKNGRDAIKATCSVCGKGMYKIGKLEDQGAAKKAA